MKFGQFFSAVREWCGDPSDAALSTSAIAFLVMSKFDFYGAQLVNAGKGKIEYKVVKNPYQREETFFESFSFGNPGLVRRLVSSGEEERWQMLDVVTNIAEFTERQNRGQKAIYFYDNKYLLSFDPSENETLEFWGERPLFSNLHPSTEVDDIPALFHHLVVEAASVPALNLLLKSDISQAGFVREQKGDLKDSIAKREIIWRNYLSSSIDSRSSREKDIYSPLTDGFYSDQF